MSAARFAFGHARVRARKARLWTRDDALVRLARPERARPDDLYAALAADYAVAARGYASARPLLMALWRRHEIENVKLAWRARALSLPPARWRPYWRELGPLTTVSADSVEHSTSLGSLVASLAATPYGDVAAAALRAHERDPLAAELSLEHWTFTGIVHEANALPAREGAAAALVRRVVCERDLDRIHRAGSAFGVSPALAPDLAVQLVRELPRRRLERIAAWRPADGSLAGLLPRGLLPRDADAADWSSLQLALRRARRRACERAFTGPPFVMAPVVAYLFLREAEIEGRRAIASGLAKQAPDALERTLAPGLMGA